MRELRCPQVKLWDSRLGEPVLSVDHGDPVQAVLMLPGGGVMVTAGSNVMKIWDVLAGGRLLQVPLSCESSLSYSRMLGRVVAVAIAAAVSVLPSASLARSLWSSYARSLWSSYVYVYA